VTLTVQQVEAIGLGRLISNIEKLSLDKHLNVYNYIQAISSYHAIKKFSSQDVKSLFKGFRTTIKNYQIKYSLKRDFTVKTLTSDCSEPFSIRPEHRNFYMECLHDYILLFGGVNLCQFHNYLAMRCFELYHYNRSKDNKGLIIMCIKTIASVGLLPVTKLRGPTNTVYTPTRVFMMGDVPTIKVQDEYLFKMLLEDLPKLHEYNCKWVSQLDYLIIAAQSTRLRAVLTKSKIGMAVSKVPLLFSGIADNDVPLNSFKHIKYPYNNYIHNVIISQVGTSIPKFIDQKIELLTPVKNMTMQSILLKTGSIGQQVASSLAYLNKLANSEFLKGIIANDSDLTMNWVRAIKNNMEAYFGADSSALKPSIPMFTTTDSLTRTNLQHINVQVISNTVPLVKVDFYYNCGQPNLVSGLTMDAFNTSNTGRRMTYHDGLQNITDGDYSKLTPQQRDNAAIASVNKLFPTADVSSNREPHNYSNYDQVEKFSIVIPFGNYTKQQKDLKMSKKTIHKIKMTAQRIVPVKTMNEIYGSKNSYIDHALMLSDIAFNIQNVEELVLEWLKIISTMQTLTGVSTTGLGCEHNPDHFCDHCTAVTYQTNKQDLSFKGTVYKVLFQLLINNGYTLVVMLGQSIHKLYNLVHTRQVVTIKQLFAEMNNTKITLLHNAYDVLMRINPTVAADVIGDTLKLTPLVCATVLKQLVVKTTESIKDKNAILETMTTELEKVPKGWLVERLLINVQHLNIYSGGDNYFIKRQIEPDVDEVVNYFKETYKLARQRAIIPTSITEDHIIDGVPMQFVVCYSLKISDLFFNQNTPPATEVFPKRSMTTWLGRVLVWCTPNIINTPENIEVLSADVIYYSPNKDVISKMKIISSKAIKDRDKDTMACVQLINRLSINDNSIDFSDKLTQSLIISKLFTNKAGLISLYSINKGSHTLFTNNKMHWHKPKMGFITTSIPTILAKPLTLALKKFNQTNEFSLPKILNGELSQKNLNHVAHFLYLTLVVNSPLTANYYLDNVSKVVKNRKLDYCKDQTGVVPLIIACTPRLYTNNSWTATLLSVLNLVYGLKDTQPYLCCVFRGNAGTGKTHRVIKMLQSIQADKNYVINIVGRSKIKELTDAFDDNTVAVSSAESILIETLREATDDCVNVQVELDKNRSLLKVEEDKFNDSLQKKVSSLTNKKRLLQEKVNAANKESLSTQSEIRNLQTKLKNFVNPGKLTKPQLTKMIADHKIKQKEILDHIDVLKNHIKKNNSVSELNIDIKKYDTAIKQITINTKKPRYCIELKEAVNKIEEQFVQVLSRKKKLINQLNYYRENNVNLSKRAYSETILNKIKNISDNCLYVCDIIQTLESVDLPNKKTTFQVLSKHTIGKSCQYDVLAIDESQLMSEVTIKTLISIVNPKMVVFCTSSKQGSNKWFQSVPGNLRWQSSDSYFKNSYILKDKQLIRNFRFGTDICTFVNRLCNLNEETWTFDKKSNKKMRAHKPSKVLFNDYETKVELQIGFNKPNSTTLHALMVQGVTCKSVRVIIEEDCYTQPAFNSHTIYVAITRATELLIICFENHDTLNILATLSYGLSIDNQERGLAVSCGTVDGYYKASASNIAAPLNLLYDIVLFALSLTFGLSPISGGLAAVGPILSAITNMSTVVQVENCYDDLNSFQCVPTTCEFLTVVPVVYNTKTLKTLFQSESNYYNPLTMLINVDQFRVAPLKLTITDFRNQFINNSFWVDLITSRLPIVSTIKAIIKNKNSVIDIVAARQILDSVSNIENPHQFVQSLPVVSTHRLTALNLANIIDNLAKIRKQPGTIIKNVNRVSYKQLTSTYVDTIKDVMISSEDVLISAARTINQLREDKMQSDNKQNKHVIKGTYKKVYYSVINFNFVLNYALNVLEAITDDFLLLELVNGDKVLVWALDERIIMDHFIYKILVTEWFKVHLPMDTKILVKPTEQMLSMQHLISKPDAICQIKYIVPYISDFLI
jgi:hypothetical protein